MRLFGKVRGAIDRFFRAAWLTPPFDRAPMRVAASACVCAAQVNMPTAIVGLVAVSGPAVALVACTGRVAGSVGRGEC
jgi:hypothetical protein